MEVKTLYPKKKWLSNDRKFTIIILLWILDKIIVSFLIWVLK